MKHTFSSKLGDWITKKDAMQFLGYKSTQMNSFIKKYPNLKISRIGRRCFISSTSLIKIIELNERR